MPVACGSKSHDRDLSKVHHHETVAQVKLCFTRGHVESIEEHDATVAEDAQSLAEQAAEQAYERYLEDGGAAAAVIQWEDQREQEMEAMDLGLQMAREAARLDRQSVEAEETYYRSVGNRPNYLLPSDWKDGLYTIETPKGHRTFRFRTQDASSDFKPGVQIVSFLHGPDNSFSNGNYTQFGEVYTDHGARKTKVWKKHQKNEDLARDYLAFLADPAAAKAAVYCKRCRTLLTVPESIDAGFGPDCVKLGLR